MSSFKKPAPSSGPVRLNKFLAGSGVASRREADRLIEAGRIRVNGRVISELGTRIDSVRDRVEADGRPVKGAPGNVYVLLHKPEGVVTTLKDPFGRRTVRDLLPDLGARVFPVGRLDADSSGALLLTNDGELAYRLTHPKFEIWKTYVVRVEGSPDEAGLETLRRGVFIEGRKTATARAAVLRRERTVSIVQVEIREGRKREVRRMLEAVGCPVKELTRTNFAGLTLEGLKPGAWRRLRPDELARLRRLAGLD
jgi:pseudouridine synthase